MEKRRLYLLSGKKRTGKDTAAHWLMEHFAYNCEQVSFAEPVKLAAKAFIEVTYGATITVEHMNGSLKEEPLEDVNGNPIIIYDPLAPQEPPSVPIATKQATFRDFAQTIGTEYGREVVKQDIWSEAAMIKALGILSRLENVVISDCRFQSEIAYCTKVCEREDVELVVLRFERDTGLEADTHPSEIDLDGFEFDNVVQNDGTLEELYEKLEEFA